MEESILTILATTTYGDRPFPILLVKKLRFNRIVEKHVENKEEKWDKVK